MRKNSFFSEKAFSLIELIVVIVILSILGTISFLSFSSQSAGARDSARLSDISNIAKGLGIQKSIAGKYPLPEKYATISGSGTFLLLQGYAGQNVLSIIGLSNGGKDPLDSTLYTYSTNIAKDKYQLLGFLEDKKFSNTASYFKLPILGNEGGDGFAEPTTLSGRYAYTRGDRLGVILQGGTMLPIQSYMTGMDVASASGSYSAYFDNNNIISGSGTALKKIYYIYYVSGKPAGEMTTSDIMNGSLLTYVDMELLSNGSLIDLSGNNDGSCFNGNSLFSCGGLPGPYTANGNGKIGYSFHFDGSNDTIQFSNSLSVKNQSKRSMTLWQKVDNLATLRSLFYESTSTIAATRLGLSIEMDGSMKMGGRDSDAGSYIIFAQTGPNEITVGKWYHIAVIYDADSDNHRIYINGINKTLSTNPSNPFPNTNPADTIRIGGDACSPTYQFSGDVDDFRFYNRILSEGEIQTLYQMTKS